MAAGAYRGLTIRIGADSTKLTAALRGANSAIYKTQSELNRLNKALKLDPGNQNAAQLQFGALSSQATNLSREINVLKQGIGEMGTTAAKSIDGITIADLANDTKSATLAFQDANRVYTETNAGLEKLYAQATKLSQTFGNGLVFGNDAAKGEINDIETIRTELEGLGEAAGLSDAEIDEMVSSIQRLKDAWQPARDALDDYTDVAKLEDLNIKLAEAESKLRDVANQFASLSMRSDLAKSIQPMKDKVDLLSDATSRAEGRFNRLNEAAKVNPNSIMTAANRSRELSDATDAARKKAQALRDIIEKYKSNGIDKLSKEVGNASIAYENAKKHVADLKVELEKIPDEERKSSERARELEEALARALEEAKQFGAVDEFRELETQLREAEAASKGMKAALTNDLKEVGVAAVNAATEIGNMLKEVGGAIIDASTEVDSAYRDMRKTVDATEGQYEALYDAAMKYSQTHVTSADTMLEMEALAGQVGIAASELQNFAEVAANLDVATDIDAGTIALQMGQIVNVMSDLDADNVQGFADALVDLGNKMPAQESAIMQISQRLSSVGDVAGFSTPEILGWAAAIASTGQRSEAAATGISNTITSIQSAVSNGGDDLEAFASVVDMSADQFKKAWGEDASGVLRDFIGQLGDLGPEAIKQLEDLGIEGVRQTQTILGLSKTVENVDKALDISTGAWDRYADGLPLNGIGEAAEEASRKAEGFSGSMAKMQNSAQVLAASLGEYLAPYIDKAATLLQRLTDFVNNADKSTKDAAMGFGVLAAGIATVYPIVSTVWGVFKKFFGGLRNLVVRGAGSVVNMFGKLSAASKLAGGGILDLSTSTAKVGGAFTAIGSKLTAFLGVISGVGGAMAMVAGAIAAVGIAIGADYLIKQEKARKEAKLFSDAIGGITGSMEGFHADLLIGSDALSDYGDKWSAARIDYEEFMESTIQHGKNMMDTRNEMGNTVGMLDKYYDIINKAIGAGDDFTGSTGELQWALDGLAQITGETYSVEEILDSKIGEEAISTDKLRDSIYQLIEAKKQQSKLEAITNMRTEAVQGQMEAENEVKAAQETYDNYLEVVRNAHKKAGDIMTDDQLSEYIRTSNRHDAETLRQYASDVEKAQKIVDGYTDTIRDLDNEYDALYDAAARIDTSAFGDREGVIMTTQAMYDALVATGKWGETAEETQQKIKEFSQKIQDAGVGAAEFAELSRESPDVFGGMVEKAQGDMDTLVSLVAEWNEQHIEDKYGEVKWSADRKSFETAKGEIYEWSDQTTNYELKLPVKADTEGASQDVQEVKNEAEEGAEMPIDGDNSGASGSVEEAKAEAEEGATMPVDSEVDNSGIDEAKSEAAEGATMNVNLTLDTSSLGGDLANATSGAGSAGITIPVTLDTGAVAEQLSSMSADKEINITVNADSSSIDNINSALTTIPSEVTSTITVMYDTVQSATDRVQALVDVSSQMVDVDATYTAKGNAATKTTPAENVERLNSAVGSMVSKNISVNAYGNIVASNAITDRVWSLVNAIDRLKSKSITLTTNNVTTNTVAKSATGAYIPYGKIPKHADGIFTRPTLTNIGWVGEDGAELYSGNSLVPLTNRKYSMPYIDDISDAVAKKLGGSGVTYNTYINDAIVNGDAEVQAAVLALLTTLQRKGAMNRG